MKNLICILVLFLSQACFSQQLYDYYRGYKKGFSKGCGCSNKPPNASDLYYHSGTYNDGYNAGYTDGRIFLNQNTRTQKDDGIYEPDLDLVERALAEKQRLLNERRQIIQRKYDEIVDILINIASKRTSKSLTNKEDEIFEKFVNTLDKYTGYDLTNNRTFYQIVDWMDDYKSYFLSWK